MGVRDVFESIKAKGTIAVGLFALLGCMILPGTAMEVQAASAYVKMDNGKFVSTEANGNMSYVLSGSAELKPDGNVAIVPAAGSKTGGVFFNNAVSAKDDFSLFFLVGLGAASAQPADGFAFVISKDARAIGKEGGGMGYEGIPNSVSIEFDTFNNGSAGTPHTSLSENGVVAPDDGNATALPFVNPSQIYTWVDYRASDNMLTVSFSETNDRTTAYTSSYANLNLEGIVGDTFYLGITSATGGYYQEYSLHQIEVEGVIESIKYTVTPTVGAGGTLTPNQAATVKAGESVSFQAIPDTDMMIDNIMVNQTPVTWDESGTFTVSNVTQDTVVDVTFKAIMKYTITPTVGKGGTLTPNQAVTVVSGASASYKAVPDKDMMIDTILVNGTAVTWDKDGVFSVGNVTQNTTIEVTFKKAPVPEIKPEVKPETKKVAEVSKSVSPKTGDTFSLTPILGVVFSLGAIVALAGSQIKKRRDNRK